MALFLRFSKRLRGTLARTKLLEREGIRVHVRTIGFAALAQAMSMGRDDSHAAGPPGPTSDLQHQAPASFPQQTPRTNSEFDNSANGSARDSLHRRALDGSTKSRKRLKSLEAADGFVSR